jgi:hypothetical protein
MQIQVKIFKKIQKIQIVKKVQIEVKMFKNFFRKVIYNYKYIDKIEKREGGGMICY